MNDYKLETLADSLFEKLRENKNPFNKQTVACQSIKTIQWLKAYWLKTQNDVLMNVDFVMIDKALFAMVETERNYHNLSDESLKLLIIKELSDNKGSYPFVEGYITDKNVGNLDSIKLYDLSDKLSKFFLGYERECFEFSGWEKDLYNTVFAKALENDASTLGYIINNEHYSYKKRSEPLYIFGALELDELQKKIIEECAKENEIILYQLMRNDEANSDVRFIEAPSKMREIEAVHSEICKIVKDNKDIKYNDFLVLAPNINEYATTIQRVFVQDKEGFPNIPFSINDLKRSVTDASSVIAKLIAIYKKGFFTRFDFFELLNNKLVQEIRGITDDDIDGWTKAIIAMNVYRNKDDSVNKSFDDWDYAKKRILLAKITDINELDNNIVELNDDDYIPFSSISLNDASVSRFISMIDDIKNWMAMLEENAYVSEAFLVKIEEELNKWFKPADNELQEKGRSYRKICKELNMWKETVIDDTDNEIPVDCLLYSLADSAQSSTFNSGAFFTGGVSFASVSDEACLASKYVFLLNASSAQLPKKVIRNEADLRIDNDRWPKLKNALLIQRQNCEHLTISYVYKNLKTDEDFYPSQLILDLQKGKTKEEIASLTTRIDIDETRDWFELFTIREFENKEYYAGLLTENKDISKVVDAGYTSDTAKKVRVRDMANFLKEPLMYKASKLFGNVDNTDEIMRNEYEPLALDNLNGATVRKNATLEMLKSRNDDVDFSYKRKLTLNHVLPVISDMIAAKEYNKQIQEAKNTAKNIFEKASGYNLIRLGELSLNNGKDNWVLVANKDVCIKVDGNTRSYFDYEKKVLNKEEEKPSGLIAKQLLGYVYALMDISSLEPSQKYNVNIYAANFYCPYCFEITPDKARETLNLIYTEMNDYSDNYLFPINHALEENTLGSFEKLLSELEGVGNAWAYFADRTMFDLNEQTGYSDCEYNDIAFAKRFYELVKEKKKLIYPVENKED